MRLRGQGERDGRDPAGVPPQVAHVLQAAGAAAAAWLLQGVQLDDVGGQGGRDRVPAGGARDVEDVRRLLPAARCGCSRARMQPQVAAVPRRYQGAA